MRLCFFCKLPVDTGTFLQVSVPEEIQIRYEALPAYYQSQRRNSPFPSLPPQTQTQTQEPQAVIAHSDCFSSANWSTNQYWNDKTRLNHLEELQAEFRNYFCLTAERQAEIRREVRAGWYKSVFSELNTLKQRLTTFATAAINA